MINRGSMFFLCRCRMPNIVPDKRNYRIHPEENKALIKKSITENGFGRSIVCDADGNIIAGNGVFEQAKKLNAPVHIVETDGSELIAVVRTDLKPEDKKRRNLAIMDNTTSDSSYMDLELLSQDLDAEEMELLGVQADLDIIPEREETGGQFLEEDDVSEDNEVLNGWLKRKLDAKEKQKIITDEDYYFTVVFQTFDQKVAFLKGIGLQEDGLLFNLFLDGEILAKYFGIELPPCKQGYEKSYIEEWLSKKSMDYVPPTQDKEE